MKPLQTLLPLGTLLLVTLSGHATPFQPTEVSKEANWYVHADLDTLRTSEIGETVLAAVAEKHGRQLKAVKRMFSLNPLTDLQAVTLWGPGEKDKAVALVRGNFDRTHLEDLLGGSEDYNSGEHHSHTVHTWKDKKKTQYGAFFGNDLAIIGEQKKLVLRTLDVLDKRAAAMNITSGLGNSAILLGLANLEGITLTGDEAKLIEKAKALHGRLFEDQDRMHVELVITADNANDAERFHHVLEGIVALGELANEDLQALELDTEVRVDGHTVTATISVANDTVLDHLDEAGKLGKFLR